MNIIYKISCVYINQCLERRIRDFKMANLNCVSWNFYLQGYEIGLCQMNIIYKISCVCINKCLERRIRDFKIRNLNCVSWIFYLQGYKIGLYQMNIIYKISCAYKSMPWKKDTRFQNAKLKLCVLNFLFARIWDRSVSTEYYL